MTRFLIVLFILAGTAAYSQTINYIQDEDALLSSSEEKKLNKIITQLAVTDSVYIQIILSSNYYPYNDPISFGNDLIKNKTTLLDKKVIIIISNDVKKAELVSTMNQTKDKIHFQELKVNKLLPFLEKKAYFKGIKAVLKNLIH